MTCLYSRLIELLLIYIDAFKGMEMVQVIPVGRTIAFSP